MGYYSIERLSKSEFELEALFVEPQHIRRGIGRLLVANTLKRVAKRGDKKLLIQSDPNAVNFYLAVGGTLVGSRESASVPDRYLPIYEIAVAPDTESVA